MAVNSTDYLLLSAIRHGDQKAFELFFHKYYSPLCIYASRYVKQDAVAEEIVSDVFYKFWQKRQELPVIDSVQAYLYTSTRNHALDYLRKNSSLQEDIDAYTEQVKATGFGSQDDEDLSLKEFLAQLETRINDLPKQRQLIFRLHKLQGLSCPEIATQLGLSERTVQNQVFRAVQYLKEVHLAD